MKLTRRNLAIGLLTTPVLAAPAEAQNTLGADDVELAAARERLRSAVNALNEHKVPMSVEPAFQFKA